jgi:hypothetical protein
MNQQALAGKSVAGISVVFKTHLCEIWTDSPASSKMMLFVGGLPYKAACLVEQKQSLDGKSIELASACNRIIFWRK